jgi:hypothetical protein
MKTHWKASEKKHYSEDEKTLTLEPLLFDKARPIARICDDLTFDDLKRLALIIKYFSKGK